MKKAIVYGNGESRIGHYVYGEFPNDEYVTWGCNAIYRDIDVMNLVSVDYGMQLEIYESGYAHAHKCWFGDWNIIPAYFEGGQIPLYRRIPKLKGIGNGPKMAYVVVNVSDLQEKNITGEVDPDTLRDLGLTRKKGLVKILGNGEITNSVNLKVHSISGVAKEKIEKAGGTVEIIEG